MTITKLKTKPALRVVTATHRPVDITALLRAEIQERDWEAVHIQGQRNPPVGLSGGGSGDWAFPPSNSLDGPSPTTSSSTTGRRTVICFRDMTFCSAECLNMACPRQFTKEQKEAARKWWSKDGAPIAFADFHHICPDYQDGTYER